MFDQRHPGPELLDGDDIPTADLHRNLYELDVINRLLGGYRISLDGLRRVLRHDRPSVLVDIGSGGGDTLKHIARWNRRQGYDLRLAGVDLKPDCIAYATQHDPHPDIRFICDDYRVVFDHLPHIDLLHASLFCHHLTDGQIVALIDLAQRQGCTLLINDLMRHPLAYYAIGLLTRLFSRSYLVKHDAPRSVLRGFRRREWLDLLAQSTARRYEVRAKWAFRHQIIVYADT
ncbi:MAG: class I SAM-dependent methyltransferase [Bacteroidia bacterium]